MYYEHSNLHAVEAQQLGNLGNPLLLAAGLLPLATGLLSAFRKQKKEKTGPSQAEIAAMQAQAAAEQSRRTTRNILIGVAVVGALGVGGYFIYRSRKGRKR